jgi:hypothetical protein
MGLVKKSTKTVVLQVRTNVDYLSCELWKYFGEHLNTKKELKKNKDLLLSEINKSYNQNFKHLIID